MSSACVGKISTPSNPIAAAVEIPSFNGPWKTKGPFLDSGTIETVIAESIRIAVLWWNFGPT